MKTEKKRNLEKLKRKKNVFRKKLNGIGKN